ncbi:hypothetical protein CJD36_012240 [Flavipsychrobacter stenotrophus]|uniref:histidine kinase n=1 Tax=Flavipsychrobacter stenotrophus TaxID=2077091 RepID=A0A2S7SV17_9BACT|nr:PAS domain S-box protein [Flavipsychrobacter stenotrophus]PQJ10733.1 hypothetical protein CJD36_012240 [Flavipsychrobacter stenotrophus]
MKTTHHSGEQKALFESIINYSDDAIISKSLDGLINSWNRAAEMLFGYTYEEVIGQHISMIIPPERISEEQLIITKIKAGENVKHFETERLRKNGSRVHISLTVSPIKNDDGVIIGASKIALQALLHNVNQLARVGGWEIDFVSGAVYWSSITKEIHEVPVDYQPDGISAILFYAVGVDRDLISQKISQTIESGIQFDIEIPIITAKGNKKWVRVVGDRKSEEGVYTGVYGSFQDIDARKNAQVAADKILNERNTILESIGDAFFAVERNWVVTYWNNVAEKILGTPKENIVGYGLWDVFADSRGSKSYINYTKALDTNMPVHFEEYYKPLDTWYEISAYPSPDGLSVYFKDINDRKNAEIKLKLFNDHLSRQKKELEISNAELEQFAYVASHDLQEPLRMVTSFLVQLEKKYSDVIDEAGKRYIYFAVDGAKRMRQIILDLLEFSRVGRHEDKAEDIDMEGLVKDICVLYKKQVDETAAFITTYNLPVLHCARSPMRQVLQNLIGNGLKYFRPPFPPSITISATDVGAFWQFSVADNGIGISEEYFDKIFIIFQRLHQKEEYSGTGMGLAIAKKIVENLGGNIWVTSQEGVGSTFYFTILKK